MVSNTPVAAPAGAPPTEARRGLSPSARIGIGIVSGVAVGLFFGERTAVLQIAADGFIKLLQMTVLPYVVVSIVAGLGALDAAQAREIGKRAGVTLLVIWAAVMVLALAIPIMYPPNQTASFFSTTLVEEREPFDFLNLYIPTNPFHSLANNVVPAVVLFSMVLGIALIGVPDKARLLDVLQTAGRALSKATNFVLTLIPFGMFAIAAVVSGTLSVEDLARLQVYLVSYIAVALLVSLWVLPGLVATLTPVPYRALIGRTRDVLLLAFMTSSLFAVLPLLTERAKELVRDYAKVGAEGTTATDVIVPASFNFPHPGKIVALSFVLFAGWFTDTRVPFHTYPQLAATGLLVMFGSSNSAIPFLLDMFRIPSDTFRLFVTSGIVTGRFGTLLASVHTVTLAVLGSCAMAGALAVSGRKLLRFGAVTLVLAAAVLGGSRVLLQAALSRPYDKDTVLTGMGLRRDRGQATVYDASRPAPALPAVTTTVLDRVRDRRVLRVGYFDDSLPYVFTNRRGELVGFDVEMGMQLARDLDVAVEFVPLTRAVLGAPLDPAVCDVIMSGVVVSAVRSISLLYSTSYLDETVAFVVPDNKAAAFSEWSSLRAMGKLRLGMPPAPYFARKLRAELGDVDIVTIERAEDMFKPQSPPLDAVVLTAERGSAFTLLRPEFSVAVPKPRPLKVPLAYVIAGRDAALASVVDTWIELKRKDGTVDELFAYWILGRDSAPKPRRWSILDDVIRKSR